MAEPAAVGGGGALRRRLSFSLAALGALLVDGLLTVVLAATRWYWAALLLWAAISGLGIFFNINTISLRQQIVPNHLLGRVMSIAGVLAWSAIPVGALAGGWAVERTGSVALVYGVVGALVALIALAFSFGPVGHAERYLPAGRPAGARRHAVTLHGNPSRGLSGPPSAPSAAFRRR